VRYNAPLEEIDVKFGSMEFVLAAVLIMLGMSLGVAYERTSGPSVYADPATGCEYLVSSNGTLVPRFNATIHLGCRK
jgi:hypothetical protein